ncbi:hypothetical protein MMC17_005068 [Xylographa soralifera]|nr:hypothetical protein [Xylographa soralifera]
MENPKATNESTSTSTFIPVITHPTSSRPRREIAPIRNGSRFLSQAMWHLTVGASEAAYDMHEHVLCQSPVLAAMCSGNFRERASHSIQLPDDDAEACGYVVEYLFTQDCTLGSDDAQLARTANILGNVYILAEKYGLESFKTLTLHCIESLCPYFENQPVLFFRTAGHIYEGTPASDLEFRPFFKRTGLRFVPKLGSVCADEVVALVSCGGDFARDLTRVLIDHYSTSPHMRGLLWG